jgi:DNA processing protein
VSVPDTAWVALSLAERIGSKTLSALLRHFGDDTSAILAADSESLQQVPGVGPRIASAIKHINLNQVERDMERWRQAGVMAVTVADPLYPSRLRELDDAPPTLFLSASWQPAFDHAIAIVGTREPSRESAGVARRLAGMAVQRGYTVVSGLALGIDTHAHFGALTGQTVAVLGCGILNIYPQQNRQLAGRIRLLMCEVRPDSQPSAANLVARNRLISGLSEAVIVVETDIDGGAMHAARFAMVQGRRVYAVDNDASGNRDLIERGATAVPPDWDMVEL